MLEKEREETFADLYQANEVPVEPPPASAPASDPAWHGPVLDRHCFHQTSDAKEWKTPTFGSGQMKKELRRFEAQDSCDLHEHTREQAFERVDEFLAQCLARGYISVRIIHGRGKGTLRRSVRGWLAACPLVLYYAEEKRNEHSLLVRLRHQTPERS